MPYSYRIFLNASSVIFALLISVLTVMVRVSNIRSFLSIPYSAAFFIILSAIATLFSAVSGMPSSSRVRATTAAPYFLANGNTASMLSSFPLTLLRSGFPLYIRRALSMVFISDVSIWSGRVLIAVISSMAVSIISHSSISGRPTFTSRISEPASSSAMASFMM